jgi:hypothetical protein
MIKIKAENIKTTLIIILNINNINLNKGKSFNGYMSYETKHFMFVYEGH